MVKDQRLRQKKQHVFFAQIKNLQAGDIVILSGSVPPALGNDFYEKNYCDVPRSKS